MVASAGNVGHAGGDGGADDYADDDYAEDEEDPYGDDDFASTAGGTTSIASVVNADADEEADADADPTATLGATMQSQATEDYGDDDFVDD